LKFCNADVVVVVIILVMTVFHCLYVWNVTMKQAASVAADHTVQVLQLVLVQVLVVVLVFSSPTSLRFGVGTFFVPDLVHV